MGGAGQVQPGNVTVIMGKTVAGWPCARRDPLRWSARGKTGRGMIDVKSRMRVRMAAAGLTAGLVLALAGQAQACSLPPPPISSPPMPRPGIPPADLKALGATWNIVDQAKRQVTERDARIWRQSSMFDAAAGVLLVRIASAGRTGGTSGHPDGLSYVAAKPLRWVKGSGDLTEFRLEQTGMTSCGPTPEFDAIGGEVGQVFLVYLSGSALRQEDVVGTLAVSRIDEARTLAALDAALN